MSDFNSTLHLQHEDIMKTYNGLKTAWDDRNESVCKHLSIHLQGLIKSHHQDEYDILFHKLFGNPVIQTGGPFCMYFFDFFMMNRPFTKALNRINELKPPDQKLKEIEIPESLAHYFKEKSMLSVPIEEHLSQEALIDEIQASMQSWEAIDQTWVSRALEDLWDILKRNIEKEETCLWAVAKSIVS